LYSDKPFQVLLKTNNLAQYISLKLQLSTWKK